MVQLIAALFLLTVVTRALPFLFAKQLEKSSLIHGVEKKLPAYLMLLLVLYEIKPASFFVWPYGLPAVIALISLLIVHVLFRQVLLSLAISTISYIFLIKCF